MMTPTVEATASTVAGRSTCAPLSSVDPTRYPTTHGGGGDRRRSVGSGSGRCPYLPLIPFNSMIDSRLEDAAHGRCGRSHACALLTALALRGIPRSL